MKQVSSFMEKPPGTLSPFPSPQNQRDHRNLCGCRRAKKSHCISVIGVTILVLTYTAMGSILFVTLEGEIENVNEMETAVAASKPYPTNTDLVASDIRKKTVNRLWSITEDLNILYKENWTRLAAQEVQIFQNTIITAMRATKPQQTGVQSTVKPHKWTYASAFLYSLTLITTIGFGGISTKTQWGRIATIIYALFGIPIILLYLSTMGEGLSSAMRCIFRKIRPSSKNSTNNSKNSYKIPTNGILDVGDNRKYNTNNNVPISICIMILLCYVTLGAFLFHKIQPWGVLESLYFCFSSLVTIGFGDLTPKDSLSQYIAAGYILIGMAVVAMCFSLIQSELINWLRKFSVQELPSPIIEDVPLVTVSMQSKS